MGTYQPFAGFHPICKVCDRGELVPRKVFRMSGPVVVIGFILLVPSALGVLVAGLVFFGVLAWDGNDPNRVALVENDDMQLRRACINVPVADSPVGVTTAEYCECLLAESKKTSASRAATLCAQRYDAGTLAPVDDKTKGLYLALVRTSPSDETTPSTSQNRVGLFHMVGGMMAFAVGVASFVGGLLGWLLIMKKRVLKCTVCGATVSAS